MGAKNKSVFFCKECGYESPKWLGQCPGCKAWDSFVEEPVAPKTAAKSTGTVRGQKAVPVVLSKIEMHEDARTITDVEEFDRVLGGGIVKA